MIDESAKYVTVTTYRDVDIRIDGDGRFYATPPGAKKTRDATDMYNIKALIDEYFRDRELVKRKMCRVPVRSWDTARGQAADVFYLGTRGRATATHERGHAFTDGDDRNWTLDRYNGTITVLPDSVTPEQLTRLENAYDEYATAKTHLHNLTKKLTVEAVLPYIGYSIELDELSDKQNEAVGALTAAANAEV